MPSSLILSACLALTLAACEPEAAPPPPAATQPGPASEATGPYRFDQPVASFTLPDDLREISGLTVLDERHLGAIQDEDGDLYVIEQETGRVTTVVSFGPPGDYEGIALAGERLFVLRADGALLELAGWAGGEARTQTVETGLGADACDAEGLAFDAAQGRLLIACKEEGSGDLDGRNVVYAYGLDAGALVPDPVVVLDPDDVPGDKKLRPSALALHPVTGHLVLLSSNRESLVGLDASGAVAEVWDLKPAAFEQPEGLAFLPDGDVFVASEGDDGPAVLLRFAYAP